MEARSTVLFHHLQRGNDVRCLLAGEADVALSVQLPELLCELFLVRTIKRAGAPVFEIILQLDRIAIRVHGGAGWSIEQLFQTHRAVAQLGDTEQIERPDQAPDLPARRGVLHKLGENALAANRREVIGHA